MLPYTKERGSIIPHILSVKCASLILYPTYSEYINYCYGFMTADLPWLNKYFGTVMGNSRDVIPNSYLMYYSNLSLVSTYFLALIVKIILWFCLSIVGILKQSMRLKIQSFKSLIYNIFSLGAIIAGCLSLQGIILNPLEYTNFNTVFYIIGVALYFGILVQIIASWTLSKTKIHHQALNNS